MGAADGPNMRLPFGVLVCASALCIGSALSASAPSFPDCSPKADAHVPYNGTLGPFAPVATQTIIFQGHPIVLIAPQAVGPFPLMVFMHGSTGQIGMYQKNLANYASHGFLVAFPYIKDPEGDKNPLTTNTNGEYILHAIDYVNQSQSNSSSPIYGKADMSNIVVAGHSMGATCSIMASHRAPTDPRVPAGAIKLTVTQHPGICGPTGPPPWPSTWLESDLAQVASDFPMIFTTATNDGAFWPAPLTAKHELGCFNGTFKRLPKSKPAAFIQFSAAACPKTGEVPPFDDSGHDCPFKSGVETPWVLTAMKLYAQQQGNMQSQCAKMLYGTGDDSLAKDPHVDQVLFESRPL